MCAFENHHSSIAVASRLTPLALLHHHPFATSAFSAAACSASCFEFALGLRFNLNLGTLSLMANREPIQVDEWYHCYNRGVDKREVFLEERDYERLLLLMYLGKRAGPIQLFNESKIHLETILNESIVAKKSAIVEIGAYALMPNHFHFVLKEIQEGGIALFMQKVFTGYTMYFNQKNERTGALFAGTFKSKHIADDQYLKHLVSYVHLNPADLFESGWRRGGNNISIVEKGLREYPYSSLPDFLGIPRPHRAILDRSIFELFERIPSMKAIMREAKTYENLNV